MRDITYGRRLSILCFRLRFVFITIGSSLLSIALSIIVIPSLILMNTLYLLAFIYVKFIYGNAISAANGLDIMYSIEYPETNPYINTVTSLDGDIRFEDMKRHCMKFLNPAAMRASKNVYRRVCQRLETHFGYTFFRDDPNFDISKQMTEISKKDLFGNIEPREYFKNIYSNQGNDSYGEFIKQESQIICERMLDLYGNKKLSSSRPQWELVYYKHPAEDRSTILFHGHHSLTDGVNVLRFALKQFGDRKIEYTLPYSFYQENLLKRLFLDIFSFFMIPYAIWRLTNTWEKNPLTTPTLSGNKIFVKSPPYPVEKMKAIKKKCNVNMITLLFNSLAYALRCHYRRRGANIRKSLAVVPVPFHDFDKNAKLQNEHALHAVFLRTDCLDPENDSALNRLNETKKLLYKSVRDPSFLPIHWIVRNLCPILPRWIIRDVFKMKGFTTSFSNIACPTNEEFSLCNRKGVGKENMFWLPDREPIGMGVSSCAYMGQCSFGLIVDKALMKNQREAYLFLEDYIQEFENFAEELNLNEEIKSVI